MTPQYFEHLFCEDNDGAAQRKHVLPKKVINRLAQEGQINYNEGEDAQDDVNETLKLHFTIKRPRLEEMQQPTPVYVSPSVNSSNQALLLERQNDKRMAMQAEMPKL